MALDYSGLPHPDYDTHQGMKGHRPETVEEKQQGYVKRLWAGRAVRLRCCFCPYEAAFDEAGMRLHVFQIHWLKANPGDAQEQQAATRAPQARLFTGDGKLVTEMPNTPEPEPALRIVTHNAPVPPRMAPAPAPVVRENFQDTELENRLAGAFASMVEDGTLNGENEN